MPSASDVKASMAPKTPPAAPKPQPKPFTIEEIERIIKAAVDYGNSLGYGIRVMSGEVHPTPGQHTPDDASAQKALKTLTGILG